MKARAERIDNGELVEGYYNDAIDMFKTQVHYIIGSYQINCIIRPETLEYKVDDKWFTMTELEALVKPSEVVARFDLSALPDEVIEDDLCLDLDEDTSLYEVTITKG